MALYPTILVAVNPDDNEAHRLVVKAAVVAEQNNAELHVAFVEPGMGNVSFADAELELDAAHESLEHKRQQQLMALSAQSPYHVTGIHLANGDVIKHLIALTETLEASLVIIGCRKSGVHWLGDVGHTLSQHIRGDVLVCQ
ncbi:universal stress protein [Photobacterium japonica]|uniref:universal stress protein n=1 Tax=Photobacterium japonica TaxID=2910235 RepID=UPI003D0A49AE